MKNTGIVVSLNAGFYDVAVQDKIVRTRARGLFRKQKLKPMVGDNVTILLDDNGTNYLTKIGERKNLIGRPAVANVSHVLLIISCVEPDFDTNLLDKFLTFFAWKQVPVSIYLSKTDLTNKKRLDEIKQTLNYYQKIGYPIYVDQDDLVKKIDTMITQYQIWTLAGQSGAGKSTLLNLIKQDANQATGEISQSLNRGKHTTRTVQLFEVGAGFLADTPGFSSIGLKQIKVKELKNYFVEMVAASKFCKFRECQHLREPGCEVKKLVADKEILQSRYDDYLLQRQDIIDQRMPEYLK